MLMYFPFSLMCELCFNEISLETDKQKTNVNCRYQTSDKQDDISEVICAVNKF